MHHTFGCYTYRWNKLRSPTIPVTMTIDYQITAIQRTLDNKVDFKNIVEKLTPEFISINNDHIDGSTIIVNRKNFPSLKIKMGDWFIVDINIDPAHEDHIRVVSPELFREIYIKST